MKNKKYKKYIILSLLAVFAIGSAFAFLTARDSKVNRFSAGNVDIELWETLDMNGDGVIAGMSDDGEYDKMSETDEVYGPKDFIKTFENEMPSIQIEQSPWIINTGNISTYTYMVVGIPTYDISDITLDTLKESFDEDEDEDNYHKSFLKYILTCYGPAMSERQIRSLLEEESILYSGTEKTSTFQAAINRTAVDMSDFYDKTDYVDYKITGTYENDISVSFGKYNVNLAADETTYSVYGIKEDLTEVLLEGTELALFKSTITSNKETTYVVQAGKKLYNFSNTRKMFDIYTKNSAGKYVYGFNPDWYICDEFSLHSDTATEYNSVRMRYYVLGYKNIVAADGETPKAFDRVGMSAYVNDIITNTNAYDELGYRIQLKAFSIQSELPGVDNVIDAWVICSDQAEVNEMLPTGEYEVTFDGNGVNMYANVGTRIQLPEMTNDMKDNDADYIWQIGFKFVEPGSFYTITKDDVSGGTINFLSSQE